MYFKVLKWGASAEWREQKCGLKGGREGDDFFFYISIQNFTNKWKKRNWNRKKKKKTLLYWISRNGKIQTLLYDSGTEFFSLYRMVFGSDQMESDIQSNFNELSSLVYRLCIKCLGFL